MKINEVAKLTGITVRTLHYYDEIGLLKPSRITESGYRIYDDSALETLQQILFFKELDFPLNEIKNMVSNPNYDKKRALSNHKELLMKKRHRIDRLIALVDNTLKGESVMSFKEFDMTEIESAKQQYVAEVKERWGKTEAYEESERKTNSYNAQQWKTITESGNQILKEFGQHKEFSPNSNAVQELVRKWQNHITESFYNCTNEILCGLGKMYVSDQRFTENIDQFGKGTAELMAKAIEIYCAEENKQDFIL